MTDHHSDTDGVINQYRAAIPLPNPAYRDRVRHTLVTARPSPLVRFGWRVPALGAVSLAAAFALVLALLPLHPRSRGSASAAALLIRAAQAAALPVASSGTAEWTHSASQDELVPSKAAADLGVTHLTTTWAIADNTHFRTDIRTSSPPLETQTLVYAANGGSYAVVYLDIDGIAFRMPLPKNSSPAAAGFLLTGGAVPPIAQTIRGYVDQYNHLRNGVHARMLGQHQYLGRTADVVEVHPVGSSSSSSCTADTHGKQRCKPVTRRYGKERIWVDDQHLMILKVQVRGVPAQYGGNYTYRVTSITFDQQPSSDQLAFTSPVPVTDPSTGSNGSGGSTGGPIGGNAAWQAPDGFISAGLPIGPHGAVYRSMGSGQGGSPGGGGTASASVIFSRTHRSTANFVLVQERQRKNGAPPLVATGAPAIAGTCSAMTGTFPDGIHWLGFSRNAIYVLVSSDSFSESKLVHYVATRMCG